MMPRDLQTRVTVAIRLAVAWQRVAVLGWDAGEPVLAVPPESYAQACRMGLRAVACESVNALED